MEGFIYYKWVNADVRNKDFDHLRSEFLMNKNNPSYQGERFNSAVELLNKAPSVELNTVSKQRSF